ncbi:MAG: (2Fe-2S)-binding protein [Anaerolineaceae bacterium]|nr:(2Fe-2S)-binding protein [Anaerolineaceae bacterium]
MNEVKLIIDEKAARAPAGSTILMAAKELSITIPTICYHDFCTANAVCRICVVEVEGSRNLVPSCIAEVREGMIIHTQTERVRRARRTILEMLISSVDVSEDANIQAYIQEYQASDRRFPGAEQKKPDLSDDNSMYIRDYSKCILCWRCVQVCAEDAQYTFAINFSGRGYETSIDTFYHQAIPESTCVFCGQCIGVCPTGALKPKKEWLLELGYSQDEVMSMTRKKRKGKTQFSDNVQVNFKE